MNRPERIIIETADLGLAEYLGKNAPEGFSVEVSRIRPLTVDDGDMALVIIRHIVYVVEQVSIRLLAAWLKKAFLDCGYKVSEDISGRTSINGRGAKVIEGDILRALLAGRKTHDKKNLQPDEHNNKAKNIE